MKNAIIYARVAAESQSETGTTLQNQVDKLKQYCELNGFTVTSVVKDEIGTGSVTDLKEVVSSIEGVTHFVVTDLTRISRDAVKCQEFCQFLENKKILLHVASDDSYISTILQAVANHDSKLKSQRIKAGIARKKAKLEAVDVSNDMPKKVTAAPWRVYELRRREREKRAQRRAK